MAESKLLRIVLQAVDQASGTIKGVGDSVGKFGEHGSGVFQELASLAGETATDAINNLRTAVGGFAETSIDPVKQVGNAFHEFEVKLGAAVLSGGAASGSFGKVAQALADLGGWIEHNQSLISAFIDGTI